MPHSLLSYFITQGIFIIIKPPKLLYLYKLLLLCYFIQVYYLRNKHLLLPSETIPEDHIFLLQLYTFYTIDDLYRASHLGNNQKLQR